MPEQAASHGLKFQARVIAPQVAEKNSSRWFAGTNALREENEVQLLQLAKDRDVVKVIGSYSHPSEVWCIAPNPVDSKQIATVSNKDGIYRAAIYSLPLEGRELQEEGELTGHKDVIRAIVWQSSEASTLTTVEDGFLRTWRITEGSVQEVTSAEAGTSYTFWTGVENGKDRNVFSTAGGTGIQVWDLRTMKTSSEKDSAHSSPVRDVDFAHNADHFLASCGDDCRVRIWDLRSFAKPVTEVVHHAHWVWQAKFNPAHDQLLISSSSDTLVKLLHFPSLARPSAAGDSFRATSQRSTAAAKGVCAASFDVHEESIHGVAWSAVDPWIFASLSYDGRIAINRVPSNVKYKILI